MKTLKCIFILFLLAIIPFACDVKPKSSSLEFFTLDGIKEKKITPIDGEQEQIIKVGAHISYPKYVIENKVAEKIINDFINTNIIRFLKAVSNDTISVTYKGVKEQFDLTNLYCLNENIEAYKGFEEPKYLDRNILSVKYYGSVFTFPAAHPYSFWGGYTFDNLSGKNLEIRDIFKEGYEKFLIDLIKNNRFEISKDEYTALTPQDFASLEESDIELFNNFWITDSGVHFWFNPYELGAYATRGEIIISFDNLSPILLRKDILPINNK